MGTIGFEPITPCSSGMCSTNWSYIPKVGVTRIERASSCSQSKPSTSDLHPVSNFIMNYSMTVST